MNKNYILFIHSGCNFCKKAIAFLNEKEQNFKTLDLTSRPLVLKEIKKIYGWQTVPMVFEVTGEREYKLIGGYTDLMSRLESEDL